MYDTFYIDELNQPICSDCKDNHDFDIVDESVNWEDESLYCDSCSEQIHSQYGNDNYIDDNDTHVFEEEISLNEVA